MKSRGNRVWAAWAAAAAACLLAGCLAQTNGVRPTRFTCQGRPTGYYADVDTGCQVYHMCDGMGRQFTYSCPNTTLFQQRMLVCDHWYMVNCSKAESDYDANLLIGQRDKPFVSDHEMALRTPRPDILTVPYNHNYYDGLKQAETKYPTIHTGNSINTAPDTSGSGVNSGLDSGKTRFTPTQGSTGHHHGGSNDIEDHHVSSTRPPTTVHRGVSTDRNSYRPDRNTQPSTIHLQYSSSTVRSTAASLSPEHSDEFELDIRMHSEERPTTDAVVTFIKRFDPDSPATSRGTAMTTSEILDINRQLPAASEASAENYGRGVRRKSIGGPNKFNTLPTSDVKNRPTPSTVFRTANTKPTNDETLTVVGATDSRQDAGVRVPDRILQPPKTAYPNLPSTTMGPPIYYEWKWAVPAFDLEPPKADSGPRNSTDSALQASESGRPTFRNFTTRSPTTTRSLPAESSTAGPEYDPSSYFIPDYIFPLDNPHPGYQERGAQTSFQVNVPEKGRSYGENPSCPQCHPAYLKPGTCEPCVVQR